MPPRPPHGLLILVFLLPLCPGGVRRVTAQVPQPPAPVPLAQGCRAERDEGRITTTVVFGDGFAAQAHWKIQEYSKLARDPRKPADVELEIEAAIEGSAAGGWKQHPRFGRPLRMRLVRTALDEIVGEASASWCRTVEVLRAASPAAPLAALARIT